MKGCKIMKKAMQDINNLAKAYKMAKETLAAEYGEAFTTLSEEQQAKAVGYMLADILGI